jgi:hypothetical protein
VIARCGVKTSALDETRDVKRKSIQTGPTCVRCAVRCQGTCDGLGAGKHCIPPPRWQQAGGRRSSCCLQAATDAVPTDSLTHSASDGRPVRLFPEAAGSGGGGNMQYLRPPASRSSNLIALPAGRSHFLLFAVLGHLSAFFIRLTSTVT